MIEFRLSHKSQDLRWQFNKFCWRRESDFIIPFANPKIDSLHAHDGERDLFFIRERITTEKHPFRGDFFMDDICCSRNEFERILTYAERWPLEFFLVLIEKDKDEKQTVQLRVGKWGSAPLYLSTWDDALVGHWDITKMYRYLQPDYFNELGLIYYLCRQPRYAHETIFKNIFVMTERSKAIYRIGTLQMQYPHDAVPQGIGYLEKKKDPFLLYNEILSSSIKRWLNDKNEYSGAELSGGLDSTIVAINLSKLNEHKSINTYGLLIDGSAGTQQRARRNEMIQRFSFSDTCMAASHFPPLHRDSPRLIHSISPFDEQYYEAVNELSLKMKENGHQLIFTGIGGDELMTLKYNELPRTKEFIHETLPSFLSDHAVKIYKQSYKQLPTVPLSNLPISVLQATAMRAPLFLRNGIWPVNPLCTPELFAFCQSLPKKYRLNKTFHRDLLLYFGCSHEVAYPKLRENFSSLMRLSLKRVARPLLKKLFRKPLLEELGYLDSRKLNDEYDKYCSKNHDSKEFFYEVAVIELLIRQLSNQSV